MTGAAATFDAALAEGRLLLQRPASGGPAIFPPREFAPATAEPLDWIEASGLGTVHSFTWVGRRPPEPAYNVVLVELAEGARMMSRVEGVTPDTLVIGMAVRARIADGPLIVFDPVASDATPGGTG